MLSKRKSIMNHWEHVGNPALRGQKKLSMLIMLLGHLKAPCNCTFSAEETKKYIGKRLLEKESILN